MVIIMMVKKMAWVIEEYVEHSKNYANLLANADRQQVLTSLPISDQHQIRIWNVMDTFDFVKR
eukprot:UN06420